MSFIRDNSNTLVNLDYVATFTINELEASEGGHDVDDPTHGIFANDADGESYLIVEGDEGYCLAKLEQLTSKLPMVRP